MCGGGGEEAVKVVPRQVVKGLQIQTLFCGLRVGRHGDRWVQRVSEVSSDQLVRVHCYIF